MNATTEDFIQSLLTSIQDIQRRLNSFPELDNEAFRDQLRNVDVDLADVRDSIL